MRPPAVAIAMLVRALVVFLVIAAIEVLHGFLRTQYLIPVVGDLASRQIGVFTGSLLILAVTVASIRWIGTADRTQLLGIGVLWVALMAAFEVTLGRAVLGFPWERILEDFDPARGGLLPIGFAVLALSPLVAARLRRRR